MNAERRRKPLYDGCEWTFDLLHQITGEVERIADEELVCFSRYPMQIEIISERQMLDAVTSVGMPVSYAHWSFGKEYLRNKVRQEQFGGKYYEIVINTKPCLVYCVDSNSATMQAIVIAHAGIGHNAFYANNNLFRDWTHPEDILRYLVWGSGFIRACEDKYGPDEVEAVLDACHALRNVGVDRYRHPKPLSVAEEAERQMEREEFRLRHVHELWNASVFQNERKKERVVETEQFPRESQENILRFVEEHAPMLPPWKREIIRFIRNVAQYFFPQAQTKLMNEGFACFIHRYLMERLYTKGVITVGAYAEFLASHTNLVNQMGLGTGKYTDIINPYALGYALFEDIRRICEQPTREDREYFPEIAGEDWRAVILDAIKNYRDESFVQQYLSPKVVRDFGMFVLKDDHTKDYYEVTAIQDRSGFEEVRRRLANNYGNTLTHPDVEVVDVDRRGDRTLTVRHEVTYDRWLDGDDADFTLQYLQTLWGFPVQLETADGGDSCIACRVDSDGEFAELPETDDGPQELFTIAP